MRRARTLTLTIVLAAFSVTAGAQASQIDYSKLTARRDSFALQAQGRPIGFVTGSLEKTDKGFRYVETTTFGPNNQVTTVEFDPTGVQSTRQTGATNGVSTHIDIVYKNGKATGVAVIPGQMGGKDSTSVDVAIPAGVIDDNMLIAIFPGLAWKPGATFSLPVVTSGKGKLVTVTLTVTGTETITLPTGPVETFKVDVTGTEIPLTMWVAMDNYVLIQASPPGIPLVQQATKH